ncbi:hypothetical protein HMPREF3152_05245 [Actinomyces sp. HMSC06A08]|uniref:UPF0102 protein CYJ19_04770 n=1 Tax=Winkia neuii TaxID=33007 RepID=A0A2I1IPA1_9ACTO|nr:YraN family protein [Winkia neuii]OFJ71431.1 hypothetical protein HMPREF2851_07820 [Actinomyces sp. HMSC064C12]OFK01413.1 hypothetical protein HMPREF2835_09270 [Actinomyces sp. HMSC072A03]OFT55479.1 hypothetical protein HMPREF3152_05245 [Actinomyces sp. HMSC06A08]MDK8100171.1 YraN family protein [Winkia neuii]PKY72949.1 YraN family protein [Winkia neuii]
MSDALGAAGEALACKVLCDKGLQILERNWRVGHLEADIVAFDPSCGATVIFEVKTRTSRYGGAPVEAVNWRKLSNLRALAAHWVALHGPTLMRIDVVGIDGGRPPRVTYLRNVK